MKRLLKILVLVCLIMILPQPVFAAKYKTGSLSKVLEWAKERVSNPKVGYHQSYRQEQKANADGVEGVTYYDCSSFCYYALKAGGFDVEGASRAYNKSNGWDSAYPNVTTAMGGYLKLLDFKSQSPSDGWKAGDILVSPAHAVIAAKDGKGNSATVYEAKGRNGISLENQVCKTVGKGLSGYTVWHFTGVDNGSSKDTTPYAQKMKDKMKDELKNAAYKYESKYTLIAISKVTKDGHDFWLSHVIVSSAAQINKGYVEDLTKEKCQNNSKVQISSAANYLNSISGLLAANADNFDAGGTNLPDMPGHTMDGNPHGTVLIKDGEVLQGTKASGREICLHKDGNLSVAYDGESADKLVKKGVRDIFISGEQRLISNTYRPGIKAGGTPGDFSDSYKDQSSTWSQSGHNTYTNTVIGMVEPGNYYVVTGYTNTWAKLADYLMGLGVTCAKSVDSGGSTQLAFREGNKGKAKEIKPSSDNRQVPSFIYFREFKNGDPLLGTDVSDTKTDEKKEDDKVDIKNKIPEEKDLVGMEGVMDKISDDAEFVELPDGAQLSSDEKVTISGVNEEEEAVKESLISTIIHVVITSLAVGLLVYIAILWAFWIFDAVNSVITFSLVSIVTFGIYRKSNGWEDNPESKKELSLKRLILVTVIAFIVAGVIISGSVYNIAQYFMNYVSSLLGASK